MSWWRRLLNKKRLEKQVNAELAEHLERQIADNRGAGMTESEARRNALLQFGGLAQITEECRDARGTRWLETMLQDVRFGLRRSPGFAIGAICTLALGIGANTAIFSVINGVILRPLPYREPSRLVSVAEQLRKTGQGFSFSYLDFLDCQRATQSFESMAAIRGLGANVTSPGEPKYVKGALVSAGFLSVLGVKLYLGREFHADEDRPGAAPVAIISYALWRERFAGNPRAIGATLVAGGKGYAVVGVLPARFRYDDDRAVLTPIGQNDKIGTQKRDFH